VLAFATQVRGFKPGRSRPIFRAKKSSARLPLEGKKSRLSDVVLYGMQKKPKVTWKSPLSAKIPGHFLARISTFRCWVR
jgi:hypothetical protein